MDFNFLMMWPWPDARHPPSCSHSLFSPVEKVEKPMGRDKDRDHLQISVTKDRLGKINLLPNKPELQSEKKRPKLNTFPSSLLSSAPTFLAPLSSLDSTLGSGPSSSLLLLPPHTSPLLQHRTLPLSAAFWDKNIPVGALHGCSGGICSAMVLPTGCTEYLPHDTFMGAAEKSLLLQVDLLLPLSLWGCFSHFSLHHEAGLPSLTPAVPKAWPLWLWAQLWPAQGNAGHQAGGLDTHTLCSHPSCHQPNPDLIFFSISMEFKTHPNNNEVDVESAALVVFLSLLFISPQASTKVHHWQLVAWIGGNFLWQCPH